MKSVAKFVNPVLLGAMFLLFVGCGGQSGSGAKVKQEKFGEMPAGRPVNLYTLENSTGMIAKITDLGGSVTTLYVPDAEGHLADVVLGFNSVEDYYTSNMGAIVGRYANRIGGARFTLDGTEYTLARNNGENSIHGGNKGFDDVLWDATPVESEDGPSLQLTYLSKDGEEGYPGNLSVKVVYTLTQDNTLRIEYTATTDKPTVLNLTNHSYFNLSGQGKGSILDQEIMMNANQFLAVRQDLIPTGQILDVKGTPMDFTTLRPIGADIDAPYQQLQYGEGYDHCWVLNKSVGEMGLAAKVVDPKSGRVMEVYTTEPGVQFYTGNHLDGSLVGKSGAAYVKRSGFCLEVEHYPDSPNHSNFPSTVLRPGDEYTQTTLYKFSTQ